MSKNNIWVFCELVERGILEVNPNGEVWKVKMRSGISEKGHSHRPKRLGQRKVSGKDYCSFHMSYGGKQYQILTHVAVYTYFFRPPKRDEVIVFVDGDKTNTHPNNLELVKRSTLEAVKRESLSA